MTAKQQQTIIVGVVIGLVVALGAYFAVIKPKLAERTASLAASAQARTEAQTLESQVATLEAKRAALPEAEEQMAAMTEKFPNDYRQDEWLLMISKVARTSGVEVGSISPTEPTSPGTDPNVVTTTAAPVDPTTGMPVADTSFPVAQSEVSLDATGTVAEVARFISGLENMKRPLLVTTVQFGGGEHNEPATVTLVGKTFLSRPLDAPAVDGATTTAPPASTDATTDTTTTPPASTVTPTQ